MSVAASGYQPTLEALINLRTLQVSKPMIALLDYTIRLAEAAEKLGLAATIDGTQIVVPAGRMAALRAARGAEVPGLTRHHQGD